MPLGHQLVRGIPKISHERDARFRLDCFLQQASMTRSPNAVGKHSDDVYLWIELLKSQHYCGCTSRHGTCIDDQHDRCLEDLGNLGSTSHVAGASLAIIEPHDPLDHRDLSRGSSHTKHIQHPAGWHHPGIQVIAGSGRSQGEMGRIDIVRSNFEWLDRYAARAYMRNESRRNGCFAYPTGHTSEHNSGKSQQHVNLPLIDGKRRDVRASIRGSRIVRASSSLLRRSLNSKRAKHQRISRYESAVPGSVAPQPGADWDAA